MARPEAPQGMGRIAPPTSHPDGRDPVGTDWPAQAADQIERMVRLVRDNTTGRAITIARGLVLAMFAVFAGTLVVLFLSIATVRFLVAYLPQSATGEPRVWLAHGIVAMLFVIPGLWLIRRASRPLP
ncbi:MAG: hypothetical protein EXQ71_09930 [Acidimicrobiia bacterium]|nr:hypothetical protein [Acidimicrobiia bacterium]